jgi:hypothetical protein
MSAPRPLPVCVAVDDLPPIPREASRLFSPRAQLVLGACACAGASLAVYAFDPSRHTGYPPCLIHQATGLYCAGCGATRALYALLHGRVLTALHDNALFVAALPLLLYAAATVALRVWRDNDWPHVEIRPRRWAWQATGLFALMAAFMVLRNLPGFEWLRP